MCDRLRKVILIFLIYSAKVSVIFAQENLSFPNFKIVPDYNTGYVMVYDLNDSYLFRLGGFEMFCKDCGGDIYDKDNVAYTSQLIRKDNSVALTFNSSNSSIDMTQVYEFNDLRPDFDYTFHYTYKKDMKMSDQRFLMACTDRFLEDFDEGTSDWTLIDSFGIGSLTSNTDPNYSRSGTSLHIGMQNLNNPYNQIKVRSSRLPSNMGGKDILTFWIFPTEGVTKIAAMVISSSSDTDYKYNTFIVQPLMWNKIEWNFQQMGTIINRFNPNDISKIGFFIYGAYFNSNGWGNWYIDNIKFMDDNFDNIKIFDANSDNFQLLSNGARSSYYSPRLLRTGFKNSKLSVVVSSEYSDYGQIEQIDNGKSFGKTIPHFYTFSMDNHRFKSSYDDNGVYLNGSSVLQSYDTTKMGYTYGGKLNFKFNPPSKDIFIAKFPKNYKAAYTFTDDTDSSSMATTLGTYWGTSNQSDPNFGKKGLLGHDIKVLITAFNYGSYSNSWIDGSLPWLQYLENFGFEIGPHDFSNVDTGINRAVLNNLLDNFVYYFNVYTTVRHSSLRYSFCGLGRLKSSDCYWLDLYENSPNSKYIWSGGLEFGKRNAYADPWELPHHDGRNDDLDNPKKLYIYGRESSTYGWSYLGTGWGVEWNPARIDDLIARQGFASIYIHARHDKGGMSYKAPDGSRVIYPDADNLLGYLEQKQNTGEMWIEPPHIIFDYMLDKENVEIQPNPSDGNDITIVNHNNKDIKGLTVEIHDSNICSVKIGDIYQIFVKNNKITLPIIHAQEKINFKIITGNEYSVFLPRLTNVAPNIDVNSAIFDGNNVIINISPTGRGNQTNRKISLSTGLHNQFSVYIDNNLYIPNFVYGNYEISMDVTCPHEIKLIKIINNNSPNFDNSDFVDFIDFAVFSANWRKTGVDLQGDFNKDNIVDEEDLYLFALDWLNGLN